MLLAASVEAAANLKVIAFACNPNEIVANNQFSCTATIQNSGDATGTINTATLYPDTGSWLEKANYPETVNSNINSGASVEVVFSSLKGKKSGYNGFSKIMIDDVTDTYAADNGVKVNVVDVMGTADSSAGSAASGASVDVTGRAIAGGNVDIVLAFSVSSSGCSIGNQAASSTTNDMSNGQTTSHTWTVTMGTENCAYAVSAKATSNPSGAATKTDTTSGSITCSNCVSSTTTTTLGGGGGGGGGSSATTTTISSVNATIATTTTVPVETTTTIVMVAATIGKESEIFGINVSKEDYSWILAVIIILLVVVIAGYVYYHYEHAKKILRGISPVKKAVKV